MSNENHNYGADRMRLEQRLDARMGDNPRYAAMLKHWHDVEKIHVIQDGGDFYFTFDFGGEAQVSRQMTAPEAVADWDMKAAHNARVWFIREFMRRYPSITPIFE